MGLPIEEVAMLVSVYATKENKDTVVCLGESVLPFSYEMLIAHCKKVNIDTSSLTKPPKTVENISAPDFFKSLGFKNYKSMDISPYEGAEIIHNLNDDYLKPEYNGIADLIVDGGTLEHVFHLPNALKTIHKMLKVGGAIVHHSPSNGYLDHGFFQFSPTFFYDYYKINGYQDISGNVVNRYSGVQSSEPYLTDIYRNKHMMYGVENLQRATLFFYAMKGEKSTYDKVPIQTFYNEMHSSFKQDYENTYPSKYKFVSLIEGLKYKLRVLLKAKKG